MRKQGTPIAEEWCPALQESIYQGSKDPRCSGVSEQSAALPGPVRAGEQAEPGTSDPEAFFPAVDVAQPQVDIGPNALQGLQLQGATEVLCVGP